MYTRQTIESNTEEKWHWEKVKAGPNREIGWKAFVALPLRPDDGQAVYIQAARDRLQQCQELIRTRNVDSS